MSPREAYCQILTHITTFEESELQKMKEEKVIYGYRRQHYSYGGMKFNSWIVTVKTEESKKFRNFLQIKAKINPPRF